MGIDFGTKKVGIAVTNDDGTMAFPRTVVPNDDQLQATVESLIAEEGIAEVVIGHSLHTTGEANPVQAHIEAFMTDLTLSLGIPVHLEPEQYSTQAATRVQGKNEQTDASAAALILDSFITKHPV